MRLKNRTATWILALCLITLPGVAQETKKENRLYFKPNEAKSMLVLFNETTVSGGDVELIAALGEKLNKAAEEADKLKDPDKTVTLLMDTEEVRYCLAIINRSTFQAKYAGLILGIKKKLEELLPESSK